MPAVSNPTMRSTLYSALAIVALTGIAQAQISPARPRRPSESFESAIKKLTLASFGGSSQDSIAAAAVDSNGDIYVAGTTYSANFPVRNAEQPSFADSSILRTTNLGVTWTRVANPPGGATSLAPDPTSPQILFAGTPTGIYKSSDGGQTWQASYSEVAKLVGVNPGNHLQVAALSNSGQLLRSLDGGLTWSAGGSACSEICGTALVDPSGSGAIVALGTGASLSRDWGLTFTPIGPTGGCCLAESSAFDPSHTGWIYLDIAAGVHGTLYLSTDFGATWTQKTSPPTVFSSIFNMAVSPDNPLLLAAGTGDGLYKSSDGGITWTAEKQAPLAQPFFSPETNIPFVFVPQACDASGGLLAAGGAIAGSSSAAFTSDYGSTWTTPQLTHVSSMAAGPDCVFYTTRALTSDAFVAKIAPNGQVLWATYLGGSDADAPAAIAIDPQNNVYVAGATSSPDFPATASHIGILGENALFLARFSPDGSMAYAVTLSGEASQSLVALAVDASQNVYLAGTTDSLQFPVTPGTFGGALQVGSYTGYLVKVSPNAALTYATYLGPSYAYPGAILVDANQQVTVAGSGAPAGLAVPQQGQSLPFLLKLNSAASQTLVETYLPAGQSGNGQGITGLAVDSQNNPVIFGQTAIGGVQASAGAFSALAVGPCTANVNSILSGQDEVYVMKLNGSTLRPAYTAVLGATCGIETGALALDNTGAPIIAMGASSGLPLAGPTVAGPDCSSFTSAIAKLSADGSTLDYATYLPNCGVPSLALSADGSVYAGASPAPDAEETSVLHLTPVSAAPLSLNGISNAFSGDASAVVSNGLYSLAFSGITPAAANLGLNASQPLPTSLDGVEVLFDGVPARLAEVSAGQILVAAPLLPIESDTRTGGIPVDTFNPLPTFTAVQIVYNGSTSNTVWMPVSRSLPGLLTTDMTNPMLHATGADAAALNADGTPNSASNPAAAGSTVTLYATGLGAVPIYDFWESAGPSSLAPPLAVAAAGRLIAPVLQIEAPIPSSYETLPGTDLGNGIRRVDFALTLAVEVSSVSTPISNIVGLYVK
jgi:uncharacterized protein (TIGR03437 family)